MARIADLLKMKIKNKSWTDAQKLLLDAMTPAKGKAYIMVRHRANRQAELEAIRLDIADCWPREEGKQ